MSKQQPRLDPKRFRVSRRILVIDLLMGWLVRLGGFAVILAVLGILFFVSIEILPLFQNARVLESGEVVIPDDSATVGVDEWGEMPFCYDGGETLSFVNFEDGRISRIPLPGVDGRQVTAYHHDEMANRISVALTNGAIHPFQIRYERDFSSSGIGSVVPHIEPEPSIGTTLPSGAIRLFQYGGSETERLLAASPGGNSLVVLKMRKKRSLIGGESMITLWEQEVSGSMTAAIRQILVAPDGSTVLVIGQDGGIRYYLADDSGVTLRQVFHPFDGSPPEQADFLFGGDSAIFTGPEGRQVQWSLYRTSDDVERSFGPLREFEPLHGQGAFFSSNQRNRTFLTGAGSDVSLRYSTTNQERWSEKVPYQVKEGLMDSKGQNLFLLSVKGTLHRYSLDDPHPEASLQAIFGKVWYEGGSQPVYQWQSSGGSDHYEPKLSLIPLVFGSLKGTFYAMVFSVPIALLAAVCSAAFLPGRVKKIVKPVIEIMASFPSVILGFLAGFWLAPILENRVPSVLLLLVSLPFTALFFGWAWGRLPLRIRNVVPRGSELWILLPVLVLASASAWAVGPVVESLFFQYEDPATGDKIASFRMWWPQVMGVPFEQQNSMVFGFIMGFAVIPVIFTISEDALSNVPDNLTALAAALGANRWQIVQTILIPIASSGIFSALIIGFGRAVGETMIMVMATGNTPITDWNLFNGFRSLSANLAIELPEAAAGSTHYRILFLGAVLLFGMTFVMNTIAELLRQRLHHRNQLL